MLELEHRFRVVDVHTRLDPTGASATTRGYVVDPDRLEREMHQAGIVRSVVFPAEISARDTDYLAANNAVARLSVDRPFVAFARLTGAIDPRGHPIARLRNLRAKRQDWHTTPSDIEQYAYDDRFHGFKLDPLVDGLPDDEVLDALEGTGNPLLLHAGRGFPPAAAAASILRRDIPVILAHFGGYPLDRSLAHDAIDLLDDHDHCYLETSMVHDRGPIERALLEHPDRVCFGSGAPTLHPNVGVMEILTLDVSEDKLVRAFSSNAERIIPALTPD